MSDVGRDAGNAEHLYIEKGQRAAALEKALTMVGFALDSDGVLWDLASGNAVGDVEVEQNTAEAKRLSSACPITQQHCDKPECGKSCVRLRART